MALRPFKVPGWSGSRHGGHRHGGIISTSSPACGTKWRFALPL